MKPREHAARLEGRRYVSNRGGDRFAGYGITALAFESGDVFAFHRCTASSLGPPFLCVWHRDRDARWTFHTNIQAQRSWLRYFGPSFGHPRTDDLALRWTGPSALVITARAARLQLALRLDPSAAGSVLCMAARLLPERALASERVLRAFAAAGATVLGGSAFAFSGSTPSGHRFILRPRRIWKVAGAACVIAGRDVGASIGVPVDLGPTADAEPYPVPLLVAGSAMFHSAQGMTGGSGHSADVPAEPPPGRDALPAEMIRPAHISLPQTGTGIGAPE